MVEMIRHIQLLIDLLSQDAGDSPLVADALRLKATHTARVAENCGLLAEMAGCSDRQRRLALQMGWGHDLGRFLQFRRYHTFDDSKSMDHSLLSLKLIRCFRLDRNLAPEEKGLLWAAILLHNRFRLPEGLPPDTLFFAELLRDADRLDIFRVFADYYRQGPAPGSPLELGYPDTGRVTPAIAAAVIKGQSPSYTLAASVQDMRLIKLSWVYTLKTPGALRLFRATGFPEATRRVLPPTTAVEEALAAIDTYSRTGF